mmetsp:Transcript_74750/g.132031  ORF Transcript_74750/g.132031 Transcript_74750/m.132031 type:complete len:239 (-) Transcript_74750:226-942(-)
MCSDPRRRAERIEWRSEAGTGHCGCSSRAGVLGSCTPYTAARVLGTDEAGTGGSLGGAAVSASDWIKESSWMNWMADRLSPISMECDCCCRARVSASFWRTSARSSISSACSCSTNSRRYTSTRCCKCRQESQHWAQACTSASPIRIRSCRSCSCSRCTAIDWEELSSCSCRQRDSSPARAAPSAQRRERQARVWETCRSMVRCRWASSVSRWDRPLPSAPSIPCRWTAAASRCISRS